MSQFITYGDLTKFGEERSAKAASFQNRGSSHDTRDKNIFLSHSSKDDNLLPGVLLVLENHGGKVYVDKRDPNLPSDDFQAVAAHLRQAVHACPKFVLFVTENSKDSNWIPWELGLGDGSKGLRNVALFPAAEYTFTQSWAEREYLGLYRRIVWGFFTGQTESQWLVLDHVKNEAQSLRSWISQD